MCQIFAGNQGIHIQSTYVPTETTDTVVNTTPLPAKRRKEDCGETFHESGPAVSESQTPQTKAVTIASEKQFVARKNVTIRPAASNSSKGVMAQIAIIGTVALNTPSTSSNHVTPVSSQAPVQMENKTPVLGFEEWLAGINERINLLMNYQLPGTPEPLVYMVYNVSFSFLLFLLFSSLS